MTIESDHMLAIRLYQKTAKVHFINTLKRMDALGVKLYLVVTLSLARALSFNGLANAFPVVAINVGTHVAPAFSGNTIYAWSEVLGKLDIAGRDYLGALRLRTVASKDQSCAAFPGKGKDGEYVDSVVLDLYYTVLMRNLQN
jgi:2-methylfumaryl-CoA hydratase